MSLSLVCLHVRYCRYVEAQPTDIIKGVDLYGDQIVEPGTHLIVKKRVSQYAKSQKQELADDETGCVEGLASFI